MGITVANRRQSNKTFILSIPIGIAPTGTIGDATNNNKIVFGTALNDIWAGCYLYFPANACGASTPAGFYYVEMSSTTEGLVYNTVFNPASKTVPQRPSSLTAVAGYAVATAYTGHGLSMPGVLQIPVQGSSIGKNGKMFIHMVQSNNVSVNNKGVNVQFGGEYFIGSGALAVNSKSSFGEIVNHGADNKNVFITGLNSNSPNVTMKSIDTSTSKEITCSLILNNAADYAMCNYLSAEIEKKN